MVIATSNNAQTERLELKSLEGAFVVARRLTYGEKLQRREMVSKLRVEAGGKGKKNDFAGEMQMVNEKATLFDFQRCIVEHNLDKEVNGNPVPLDFNNLNDIRSLDPRAGEEIDTFLGELNNFEDDEGES